MPTNGHTTREDTRYYEYEDISNNNNNNNGSCQRTKKAMEHEGDGDTNSNWYTWNDPKRLGQEAEGVEIGWRARSI